MFLTNDELQKIGFKALGTNVLISNKASIYGAELISIGDNVRIDDFCILSGKITLGNYIHIGAGSMIFSSHNKNDNVNVEFGNFSTLSSRCVIYAISDDYSGLTMTNPMIPDKYKGVIKKKCVRRKALHSWHRLNHTTRSKSCRGSDSRCNEFDNKTDKGLENLCGNSC